MKATSVPPFTISGVTWRCFDADDCYVWVSTCERGQVSRPEGLGNAVTISVDGKARKSPSLLEAMVDASDYIARTG